MALVSSRSACGVMETLTAATDAVTPLQPASNETQDAGEESTSPESLGAFSTQPATPEPQRFISLAD